MNTARFSRAGRAAWLLVAIMCSAAVTAGAAERVVTSLGILLDPSVMADGKTAKPAALGTAQGALVVDGKPTALKYAYAIKNIYPALLAPEWTLEQRTRVDLVFSDVELPAEVRRDQDALVSYSRAGKFRGAFFRIFRDMPKGSGIKFYYPISKDAGALSIMAADSESDPNGTQVFLRDLALGTDALSGTVVMAKPYVKPARFVEPGTPQSFHLKETAFNAKLEILPPPVETKGPAAAATAEFDVFARFNEQGKRGAFDGMAALASDDVNAQLRQGLEMMGADEMKNNFFSPEILKKAIVGAVTSGRSSTLVFRVAILRPERAEHAGDATREVKLTQVDGSWKISQM